MAFLQHCLNGAIVAHYDMSGTLRIGRQSDNSIVLEDTTVSGVHAEIGVDAEGQFQFKDLGSTNGVLYRGKKVEQGVLEVGAWLTIGLHEFTRIEQLAEGMERTLRIKKSWIPGVYYTSQK